VSKSHIKTICILEHITYQYNQDRWQNHVSKQLRSDHNWSSGRVSRKCLYADWYQ